MNDPLAYANPNDLPAHQYRISLWPTTWQTYPVARTHHWHLHRLAFDEAKTIPDVSGIYTLVVQPNIAGHPACSYLMYVGQATNLKRRFHQYMTTERQADKRPLIVRLLNTYSDYLWFCYTEVDPSELDDIEDTLTIAFNPPTNTRIRGMLGRARKAFT